MESDGRCGKNQKSIFHVIVRRIWSKRSSRLSISRTPSVRSSSRPVYWFYHLSLNQFVRAAIRFIPKDETQLSPELVTAIEGISDNEGLIISRLRWSQEKIQAVSGWVKLLVMIPCYIVLAIAVSAAATAAFSAV